LFDNNATIHRHEAVAANYGQIILAWLSGQPKDARFDFDDVRHELGLDRIQFEMGLNWCRSHGYLSWYDDDLARPGSRPQRKGGSFSPPWLSEERQQTLMRWVLEDLKDDDDSGEADELEEEESTIRFRQHSPFSGRRHLVDYSVESQVEQAFFDREFKAALLAILSAALITWLVVSQFKGVSDEDRAGLALAVFMGFAFSIFLAALFVRPWTTPRKRD